jgi:hypothetical protein
MFCENVGKIARGSDVLDWLIERLEARQGHFRHMGDVVAQEAERGHRQTAAGSEGEAIVADSADLDRPAPTCLTGQAV